MKRVESRRIAADERVIRAAIRSVRASPVRAGRSTRLVKVTADSVEYRDSPSSAMVHAHGYVKARATGEPPSPGDVAHVKM